MNAKRKNLLVGIFLSVINLLIFGFFVVPGFLAIKNTSKEYLFLKKRLAEAESELANFKDFETHHQLYLKNLQKMRSLVQNQLFINKELPIEIVTFCQEEAQRENLLLEVTPFSPEKEKTKQSPFDYIFLKVTLKGDFPGFLKFLKRVENSQWLLETQNLTISKEKEGLKFDLLLKVYVQRKD